MTRRGGYRRKKQKRALRKAKALLAKEGRSLPLPLKLREKKVTTASPTSAPPPPIVAPELPRTKSSGNSTSDIDLEDLL